MRSSPKTQKKQQEQHDDFSDLYDYIMLDTWEREKHRVDLNRVHPVVVQKSSEGDLLRVGNPTIAELRRISAG